MIGRIIKIKNLGLVFADFTWNPSLTAFKPFNLIYGANGSGKTTLSRLYSAIGGNPINSVEYEIEDDQGVRYNHTDQFSRKVRVFNHDYVKDNVKILEGRAKSISILLGKENKELVDKIESNKKLLIGDATSPGKITQRASKDGEMRRKLTERGGNFTDIAKIIGIAMGGSALRDYKKTQAEKDFAKLTGKLLLSDTDLEECMVASKQESLPSIDPLSIGKCKLRPNDGEVSVSEALKITGGELSKLFGKTVESEAIMRLSENSDISNWVEVGMALHKEHDSKVCEYCSQTLPKDRILQLAKHFNDADAKLKSEIEITIKHLESVVSNINLLSLPDSARLYPALRKDFKSEATQLEKARREAVSSIDAVIQGLKNKKARTTEAMPSLKCPTAEAFLLAVDEINKIIATHNTTTQNFESVKKGAAQRLKYHYLSTIVDVVAKLDADITALVGEITNLDTEIVGIQTEIDEDMAQISSAHKACDVINEKLTAFLGHKELTFVPELQREKDVTGVEKEEVVGYRIMRGLKPAEHLSEGEKTAVAFVYFVVHLTDQGFNVADGIVVVDDPISSLDSNSLYQAFSFLKDAVKDVKQVFVFTHNFDFLKLILNWRKGHGHNHKNSGYFMVKNKFVSDMRVASLDVMDKELCDYESEYHYLFKLLKQMRLEQDDSIGKAYPIPNIARKVFDTFLTFAVPNGTTQYSKVIRLKDAGFDAQKLDAIYKFTNDQSHITGAGFNPSLVPEARKVVDELFEMMEEIAPMHFQIIDQSTN